MSKVWFLGLGAETPADVLAARLEGQRVWTINDWYRFYPWLRGHERVYNVHEVPNEHPDGSGRFERWRWFYEASGAEIVTVDDHGFKRQRIIDSDGLLKEFGAFFFGSSLGFMFAEAIREGVKVIEMEGIQLRAGQEYAYQIPSVLHNIDVARGLGIDVRTPHEPRWRLDSRSFDLNEMKRRSDNVADGYFYGRKFYGKPAWASL
jgi:hypothetical protein